MNKVFEDEFTEVQTDMIDICLEYANYEIDAVYIYTSCENNAITCDFFYKINDKLVEKYKLSDIDRKKYDSSLSRQDACFDILFDDIKKLIEVCKKYGQDMPTEIKLIYDVRKNSVAANYQYEPQYSNDPVKHPNDIVEEWFQTEKMEA